MQHALGLPTGYHLIRDPDILTLCRSDDSIVARFSRVGVNLNEVRKAAEQDYSPGTIDDHTQPMFDAVTDRPCLRVRLLGCFEMLCDGEPADLARSGRAPAIFKYLLAHRERWVSRDHLMEWLWPNSDLKNPRASLNVAICTLRKLLGECSAALRHCILLKDGYYRLCPTVWVATDVEEFDLRYQRGRRLETNPAEGAAEYEKAVELYRGEYLLEHLYEDWTMLERERLSNAYMFMLQRLAEYYKEDAQLKESIRICYRILQKDRTHEDTHLHLTECYALLGYYGRASRQYEWFRSILKSTYGTEPSVETRKRFENVLWVDASRYKRCL